MIFSRIICLGVLLLCIATGTSLTAQTVALGRFAHADYERNDPDATETITDQLLAGLAAKTPYKFVERAAIEQLLGEQALSQDGLARAAGAARVGKLLAADLILLGTFLGVPGQPQSVVLEVVEPARAETVAQVRVELDHALERGHLAPLSPSDQDRILAASIPLLAEARQEIEKRPGQVLLKLIALPNQSGDPTWGDLSVRLEEAVAQKTAATPAQRLLRTHRPDAATPENELRLLGLVEADASAWNQFADYYFWGVVESGPSGPQLRMNLWDGQAPPQEIIVQAPVGSGAMDALVGAVSDAILKATREPMRRTRPPAVEDTHRVALAAMLMEQAKMVLTRDAKRLTAAAIFFDPACYENWSYLAALRLSEVGFYQGNARIIHSAAASDFRMSLLPRFLVDATGKIRDDELMRNASGYLANLESDISTAQENYADIHQGGLLLRLRDRQRDDFTTNLEKTAPILVLVAPDQEENYRIASERILTDALDAKLDPARTSRLIEQLWPRLKVSSFVREAWNPGAILSTRIENRLHQFLLAEGFPDKARAVTVLSADELAQALAAPPPSGCPAAEALRMADFWSKNLRRLAPGSPGYNSQMKLMKDFEATYAPWPLRAAVRLKGRVANPPDFRTERPELLLGPIASAVTQPNPRLEDYSAAARAKHAPALLAYCDSAAAAGYPAAVIARQRDRIKTWLAASPPAPPGQPASAPISAEQQRFYKAVGYNPAGPPDRLMEVSPNYLDVAFAASALKSAVQTGELPSLAYLLDQGAPVEAAGMAFVDAIRNHDWPAVEYLLGKGYDPAAPWPIYSSISSEHDTFGALALAAASAQGRADLMDRLLAFRVRFGPDTEVAENAVMDRVRADDLTNLRKLIAAGAMPTSHSHSASANYLGPVIARRNLPMLKALLAAGAKPHHYVASGYMLSGGKSPLANWITLFGGISQSENWSLESTDNLIAIECAAQLNWREGVEAMLAAPAFDAEDAFEHWPYRRATDPATRTLLLRANLLAIEPASSVPGIDLACAIVANDPAAVASLWKNPDARQFRPRTGQSRQSLLAFAILEKRPAIARQLVEQGARLDDLDDVGLTPLARAAAIGDVDLVRFLAAKGADLNLQCDDGNPPLNAAIVTRQKDTALALLDLGASIAPPAYRPGADPLFQATVCNLPVVVERLLALGANPRVQHEGMSIFFPAARSNNPDLIQRFVDLGCDLSLRGPGDWTPLVTAVRWGTAESTAKLIALGVRDPLAADAAVSINHDGRSQYRPQAYELQTLHYRPDYRRCLELIQEQREITASAQAQERLFWDDFLRKTKDEVAEFLKKGGNINYKDGPLTPLQTAARMGETEIYSRKRDANGQEVITERGDAGFNDPMLAWVAFLLSKGADTEAIGQEKSDTAIVLGRRNPEIVRLLLDHKARISAHTKYSGISLLSLAVGDQQTPPATVRLLLDYGAQIDDETRAEFAELRKSQPDRIPLLEAVLTPEQLALLRGGP